MSLANEAVEHPPSGSAPRVALLSVVTAHRLLIYTACAALALLVNYGLGKEMAWDTLNYHLYAGFSAVHDRFSQDYFAAGPAAYANPYAYLPFYALVSSGLSALQVASLLALVHCVILWLTYELALAVCARGSQRHRLTVSLCAVALAAVNPVLIQQIGSSFTDITTAELVLGGWLLLVCCVAEPTAARVLCAGLLLGAATALKMTNAVHAVTAGVLLLWLPRPLMLRVRYGAQYALALGVTFAIVAAPWAYQLQRKFGNPFFPLFNNLFRSPDFTTEPLRHFRFIPSTVAEALWRPFAMLDPVPMVHEELSAPDPRYAALLLLTLCLVVRWLHHKHSRAAIMHERLVDARPLAALGSAFALDWVLWLAASGNSRYFLPMACVAAVLVVAMAFHVLEGRPKIRNYVLAVIFGSQVVQLWMGADFRWHPAPWDGAKWFEVEVPQKLVDEPNLYLSVGMASNSYIVPFLSPEAGLVNISGVYPLTASGTNGARVAALQSKFAPHLRFLARGRRLYPDAERRSPSVSDVNAAVARFGLRVNANDCLTISVHGLPPEVEPVIVSASQARAPPPQEGRAENTSYLVSCALLPDRIDRSSAITTQQTADLVLDRIEDACPQLFQPHRLPTDVRASSWQRNYLNTDIIAWVSHGEIKFVHPPSGDYLVVLGRVSDWVRAPPRLACGRNHGHYFARVLTAGAG
jgi:Glycosyltransferase family 87